MISLSHMNSGSSLPSSFSGCGFIIVGTDTGVGKTVITGTLACGLQRRGIRTGVMKPIETGVKDGEDVGSDTQRLQALCMPQEPLSLLAPYRFQHALSPLAAARLAKRSIEIDTIVSAFHTLRAQCDCLLVEGIGGVMVPLTPTQDFRDLMAALNLPCVIVSHATLGAVNHVLLTIQALETRNIPITAIVLNCPSKYEKHPETHQAITSTVEQVKEFADAPVFGPVLFQEGLEKQWKEGIHALSQTSIVNQLVTRLATRMS
ncbi:MAG: dethiobiotin synthase [Nitrospirales bacterium]|nr:dethiobiotin synthase [Nitrospirales bacterium]